MSAIRLVLSDPALRAAGVVMALQGAIVCSFGPYFSTLAVNTFGFGDAGFAVLLALVFADGAPLLTIYPVGLVMAAGMLAVVLRYWPVDGTGRWDDRPSGLSFRAALAVMAHPALALGAVLAAGTIYHTNNVMLSPVDFEIRQQKLNKAGVLENRGTSLPQRSPYIKQQRALNQVPAVMLPRKSYGHSRFNISDCTGHTCAGAKE